MGRLRKSNSKLSKDEASWSSEEASMPDSLPTMFCVVCYNEYPSYTLNCLSWETAVTKDFYVALQIPTGGQDEESVISLPFCPECHSKVAVMFSLHQQLKNMLQSFNCIRNDLAFSIVESIDKNCRPGPLDLIRQQIFERWKDLHAKSKEIGTTDVYRVETINEYLEPAVHSGKELPTDPKSMLDSEVAERRRLSKVNELVMNKEARAVTDTHIPSTSAKKRAGRANTTRSEADTTDSIQSKKKLPKNLEMPVLIPMAKLPSYKSPSPINPLRKHVGAVKSSMSARNKGMKGYARKGTSIVQQKLPKVKQRQQILKSRGTRTVQTFKPKSQGVKGLQLFKRKNPVQLADGSWKCSYCGRIFTDLTQAKRHEGIVHPTTLPLKCHLCPKGFHTSNSLRRHLRLVHEQAVEGYVKCPHCTRSFGKRFLYEMHLRSCHSKEIIPTDEKNSVSALQAGTDKVVKVPMGSPPSPEITDLESVSSKGPSPQSVKSKSKRRSPVAASSLAADGHKTQSPFKRIKTEVPITSDQIILEENRSQQPQELQNTDKRLEAESEEEVLTGVSNEPRKIIENGSSAEKENQLHTSAGSSEQKNDFSETSPMSSERIMDESISDPRQNENKVIEESSTAAAESESYELQQSISRRGRSGGARIDSPAQTPTTNGKGGVTCSICGKWYQKSQALGGHMSVHRRSNLNKGRNADPPEESELGESL